MMDLIPTLPAFFSVLKKHAAVSSAFPKTLLIGKHSSLCFAYRGLLFLKARIMQINRSTLLKSNIYAFLFILFYYLLFLPASVKAGSDCSALECGKSVHEIEKKIYFDF